MFTHGKYILKISVKRNNWHLMSCLFMDSICHLVFPPHTVSGIQNSSIDMKFKLQNAYNTIITEDDGHPIKNY